MMVLHNLMHHIKLRTSGGLLDFFFMFHQMYVTNDDPSQSHASYKKNYFQNLVTNTNEGSFRLFHQMYATSFRDANKNGMEQKYRTKNCKYC
jgi:hypothetical protein